MTAVYKISRMCAYEFLELDGKPSSWQLLLHCWILFCFHTFQQLGSDVALEFDVLLFVGFGMIELLLKEGLPVCHANRIIHLSLRLLLRTLEEFTMACYGF